MSKITHYNILGLKDDCSQQDVKDAFISLSKRFHPDVNPNNPAHHEKFIKINEAYSILSKPDLRKSYDFSLKYSFSTLKNNGRDFTVETNAPDEMWKWKDETIWDMRDKDQDKHFRGRSYYGIKGIKRVSNLWIAGGAIALMGAGALFHYFALKKSSTFTSAQLDRRDEKIGKQWLHARRQAKENGNDMQLKLLQIQFTKKED